MKPTFRFDSVFAGCDAADPATTQFENGEPVEDECGVCEGDGTTCEGCDGVPNSGKLNDTCGVCNGNGRGCWLHRTSGGNGYLTLPSDDNWSEYYPLRTQWMKLRILEGGLKWGSLRVTVDMTDFTFASHNGKTSINHGKQSMAWGSAEDCRPEENFESSFALNLVGTPFALELSTSLLPLGNRPHGKISCLDYGLARKTCFGTCGGYCGSCGFAVQSTTVSLLVTDRTM
jgi:hypothetical protein